MELIDTVELMNSTDYKERFQAEYHQTKIRYQKLRAICAQYMADKLDYTPACSINMFLEQEMHMEKYLRSLECIAKLENIDLTPRDKFKEDLLKEYRTAKSRYLELEYLCAKHLKGELDFIPLSGTDNIWDRKWRAENILGSIKGRAWQHDIDIEKELQESESRKNEQRKPCEGSSDV